MPAKSKAQRELMAIAEHHPSEVYSENKGVLIEASSGVFFPWELTGNRLLIRRIEEESMLTDKPKSIKGIVLASGPGKWISGEWWFRCGTYEWEWGYRQPMDVKPGMKVLFNSKWNDLRHGELKGTGCDFKGPLERPLSYRLDDKIHLVTEDDVFAIVPDLSFRAGLSETALSRDYASSRSTIEEF